MTGSNVAKLHPPRPCPQCGRPADRKGEATPFCSVRCADLDLGKWFDGTYTVPVVEADSSSPADPGQKDDRGSGGEPD